MSHDEKLKWGGGTFSKSRKILLFRMFEGRGVQRKILEILRLKRKVFVSKICFNLRQNRPANNIL